jgi:4-hydroxy-tetrahydrodipicolinate synthase
MPFLELGGKGGIFVYTNIAGPRVKELITRFEDGDLDGAREMDAELKPIVEALAVTTNPIPVKAALNMLGHEVGGLRLPLVEATEDEKTVIRAALERAGILAVAQA